MALLNLNFESEYLAGNTEVTVILPDKTGNKSPADFYGSGKKYPVLWLLHGTWGDHSDWLRRTRIELYAYERDVIVVMPSALNSNYANWPAFSLGYRMYDYLFEELMPLVHNWLPASDRREDNYVAGLSMGGMGACVYAFGRPEKFSGAAVLSYAPVNFDTLGETMPDLMERMSGSFANYGGREGFMDSVENTWARAAEKAKTGELPPLYVACGEEDKLFPLYLEFKAYAEKIGLAATFESAPGYRHEWRFWDQYIEKAMDFFGLAKQRSEGIF
ncbi:MAG: alpha/beta hydrolase-fold protein [Oscillospiraceae bacterium]|nr:alpha/beta hydrolase-fold protein [Oscillospiraceae bacterium]